MIDLRLIRSSPELVRSHLRRRGDEAGAEAVGEVLRLDEERRRAVTRGDELRAERNAVSKRIGELKRGGGDTSGLVSEMRNVGDEIAELEGVVDECDRRSRELLLRMPNLPLDEVPDGGEGQGTRLREVGEPLTHPFAARPHWELAESLGLLDLPRGAKISGSGFPVLTGAGAKLQRSLIHWMLDLHVREHGYRELRVPYLVTDETVTGTGQLPKFAEDLYRVDRDELWLIPTAEVPLTNLHKDELLSAADLPLKYTAYSPCFRREAGAAGKDTRGLLRVHQFDKVELVRYETPERSRQALEEMTSEAERILVALGLAYRVVCLPAGDMGFSSTMTYDLEVWAPGVSQWLEVSSVSTCGDFQARRANLRYRPAPDAKPEFVHTLNGSALALPRIMVALLETNQDERGSVKLPEVLWDLMGTERLVAS
jgi:seryl-tRNA synthetase